MKVSWLTQASVCTWSQSKRSPSLIFMARSFGIGRVRLVSIRTVSWFVNRYRSVCGWNVSLPPVVPSYLRADSPTFTVRRLSSSSVDHANGCDIEKSLSQFYFGLSLADGLRSVLEAKQ